MFRSASKQFLQSSSTSQPAQSFISNPIGKSGISELNKETRLLNYAVIGTNDASVSRNRRISEYQKGLDENQSKFFNTYHLFSYLKFVLLLEKKLCRVVPETS